MAETVYVLCALTSIACAVMLFRGYSRSRTKLLLWSSLCFVGLAANNVLLFLDKVVFANGPDLSLYRSLAAFCALALLVFGLVWDTE
jgi:hypothetical protein